MMFNFFKKRAARKAARFETYKAEYRALNERGRELYRYFLFGLSVGSFFRNQEVIDRARAAEIVCREEIDSA